MGSAYDKLIDSPIADMKNVGPRYGGSITAAQFIQRFVDKGVAWAHLDIAGMVWADKPGRRMGQGRDRFGVRLLDQYVRDVLEADPSCPKCGANLTCRASFAPPAACRSRGARSGSAIGTT